MPGGEIKKKLSWHVFNKKGQHLGNIEWWSKYYEFVPVGKVLGDQISFPGFSHECLDEISKFLKEIEHGKQ
jgi:hypothetical protein